MIADDVAEPSAPERLRGEPTVHSNFHRHVSDSAERRLGVRHETPQAILLKDGKPVWKASHFRITTEALTEALSA